jgi:hypothetical protein
VVCSLPPQGGSEGPDLHLLHSTVSKSSIYKQNSSPRSWHTSDLKSLVTRRLSDQRPGHSSQPMSFPVSRKSVSLFCSARFAYLADQQKTITALGRSVPFSSQ